MLDLEMTYKGNDLKAVFDRIKSDLENNGIFQVMLQIINLNDNVQFKTIKLKNNFKKIT